VDAVSVGEVTGSPEDVAAALHKRSLVAVAQLSKNAVQASPELRR
jgi:hypothetical protein